MSTSALLVMDVQRGIVDRYSMEDNTGYLARLRRAIDAARAAEIGIIYVTVRFRPGYPEVSPRNKSFATLTQGPGFSESHPATAIHPDVAPAPGDIVVTKRRVSAFSGSDLDVVLRAANIDTLVLTGIATSGVMLSTLRQAADLDYSLVVLADACLDGDAEVHRVLTEKVFPRQAEVLSVNGWVERLRPP